MADAEFARQYPRFEEWKNATAKQRGRGPSGARIRLQPHPRRGDVWVIAGGEGDKR